MAQTLDQKLAELDARRARLVERKRKQDTRQKIIVGAIILTEAEQSPGAARKLLDLIATKVIKETDQQAMAPIVEALQRSRAMADDVADYFDRKFAAIEKNHKAALDRMKASVDVTADHINRNADAALEEVPARIEQAFSAGVADLTDASRHAHQASFALERAGDQLRKVNRAHFIEQIHIAASWGAIMILVAMLIATIYRWGKEPIYIYKDRWLLCTAAWAEKEQSCKGKFFEVPEDYGANNRAKAP